VIVNIDPHNLNSKTVLVCLRCMCLLTYLFIYYVEDYLYSIIQYVKKKLFQVPREAIQLSIVHIQ